MGKNPFNICYIFQPLAPISSLTQSNDTDSNQWEVEKELKFQDHIYNIQKQAHEMLHWANEKYKAWHDQHHTPHSFQIRDQVWLNLNKDCLTSPYIKLKPLRYGPYSILKKIRENVFHLDIPSSLGFHLVFNVDLLLPYHAPLLEKNNLQIE